MNIAELFHQPSIRRFQSDRSTAVPDMDFLPHWPSFTISEEGNQWHFFSIEGITLRKRAINTSLSKFLQSQDKYTLFAIKCLDSSKFDSPQMYPITVQKIAKQQVKHLNQQARSRGGLNQEQLLLKDNCWKATDRQKVTLIRIDEQNVNRVYSLLWSQNIIKSEAPVTSHLKEKLTEYAEAIKNTTQQKYLKEKDRIRSFELIFTYNASQGKLKLVMAHNFKLKSKNSQQTKNQEDGSYAWQTNFRVGADDYERIQIMMEDQKTTEFDEQPDNFGEDFFQMKRMKYLKFLRRVNDNPKPKIDLIPPVPQLQKEKQAKIVQKEFQCSACHIFVEIREGQCERMVSSNRIPQIQILRQIKMKKSIIRPAHGYDLVRVCEYCYSKFLEIAEAYTISRPKTSSHQPSISKRKYFDPQYKYKVLNTEDFESEKSKETLPCKLSKPPRSADNGTNHNTTNITSRTRNSLRNPPNIAIKRKRIGSFNEKTEFCPIEFRQNTDHRKRQKSIPNRCVTTSKSSQRRGKHSLRKDGLRKQDRLASEISQKNSRTLTSMTDIFQALNEYEMDTSRQQRRQQQKKSYLMI